MGFLAADEKLDLEPINYLVAQQEQEPYKAVVLSLTHTREARLPASSMVGRRPSSSWPRAVMSSTAFGFRLLAFGFWLLACQEGSGKHSGVRDVTSALCGARALRGAPGSGKIGEFSGSGEFLVHDAVVAE